MGETGKKYNRRAVGSTYEKLAGEYLENLGYEILEYNFRCRRGEIDIIAREGRYLVFVEVKYRDSGKSGSPLEAVTVRKQQIISKVAAYYCLTHGWGEDTPCRFDVVGIMGKEITLLRNAFEYQGY